MGSHPLDDEIGNQFYSKTVFDRDICYSNPYFYDQRSQNGEFSSIHFKNGRERYMSDFGNFHGFYQFFDE